jgi:hypothetical protein
MCASPARKPGSVGRDEGLGVGHAVLGEDVAQVIGLVQGDGAGRAIAGDVNAEELGQVAKVLNFESCTKLSLERCKLYGSSAGEFHSQ